MHIGTVFPEIWECGDHGPQDFPMFGAGVQLANLIAGLVALWLWRRDPKIGRRGRRRWA